MSDLLPYDPADGSCACGLALMDAVGSPEKVSILVRFAEPIAKYLRMMRSAARR
jgi:hypothetical protein